LVSEAVSTFSARVHAHVKAVLSAGIKPVFGWVGPELCIPPLMAERDFEEFVVAAEKPYCDTIHNAGGYVWLHCHGKVGKLLERYIYMGVDVLNPLEPAKNGDVDLNEVVGRLGNRLGLEGNIEIQDILTADTETLKALMRDCVDAGAKSGRFILCPSAGFMEYPRPEPQYIDNLMTYLNYGYELLEALP
jgi:uroporphyrinogen-III decarboxylase